MPLTCIASVFKVIDNCKLLLEFFSGYSCVCQPGFHLTVNHGGQIRCAQCPSSMVRPTCEANVYLLMLIFAMSTANADTNLLTTLVFVRFVFCILFCCQLYYIFVFC